VSELYDDIYVPVDKAKLGVSDEQVDGEVERLRKYSGVWTPREGGKVEEDALVDTPRFLPHPRLRVIVAFQVRSEPAAFVAREDCNGTDVSVPLQRVACLHAPKTA
jgi:hypothetical protein